MRTFLAALFVALLCFAQLSFAASTTNASVVNIQVSLLTILTAALWVFLGVGIQVIVMFYAWRILRIHREIFGPPSKPPG
jgi:ABC-type antimicrobial peptide transport system permease subunit